MQEYANEVLTSIILLGNNIFICIISRVQSLDIQIAQLQKETTTLRKVILEMEEQKKQVVARSR